MRFILNIVISKPLNFLGFARSNISSENSFLWSRDVETLFAHDTSLNTVLSEIPLYIRKEVGPYKELFIKEWPSMYSELQSFRDHIRDLWSNNSKKIFFLMDRLGLFYSGSIDIFPVMPFFRDWPRSTPLSMPIHYESSKKILELLTHEILHRTTEAEHPQSLWHYLSMVFFIKNITKEDRFLIKHAVIYVAAAWISSAALKKDFTVPQFERETSDKDQLLRLIRYTNAIFNIFLSGVEKNLMKLAENIVASCT